MRAITVRQPWAWAIAAGHKLVENRSAGFPATYRGPLLIHASKAWSKRGGTDPRIKGRWHGLRLGSDLDAVDFRDRLGVVLALAELTDAHPDTGCCRPWGESEYVGSDQQLHRGVLHLLLEDVRRLPEPVPCRGALGLWTPPADVLAVVSDQLGQVR